MTKPRSLVRPVSALSLGAMLLVGGCGRDAEVVVYASADDALARAVIGAFESRSGLTVRFVGDDESKKTTGLAERLRRERDHPQCDVFWSSEVAMTIALADEGILAAHDSAAARAWPPAHKDERGRWFAFAARARVIAYAPDRVAPEEIPRTWTDLARAGLEGRIVMADPRFGTTGGHLGAMKAYWDRAAMPGFYEAFLLGLRDNETRMLPGGNAAVVQAVAEGDADFGMTDTDDVWAAQQRGVRVEMVYAAHSHEDEEGNGTYVIPNTAGIVAGARHAEAAALFVDFLISEECERLIAESSSRNLPLGPGRAEGYPELAVPDPLDVDQRRAAAARPAAVEAAVRILTKEEAR